MSSRLPALLLVQAFAATAALAQTPDATQPATPAPSTDAVPAARVPDAREEVIHVEDQGATIDELRVRGETKRIDVQPKAAVPPYEIVMPAGDSRATGGSSPRNDGASGQRVWRVLDF